MRTEPKYITKYLGIEQGAQSNWDKKRDVGIVNGSFQSADLQHELFGFIEKVILCPSCHLPELVHKVKKGQVGGKCYSCGWVGAIRCHHPIMKYIIKNPPAKTKRTKEETKGLSKKEKRLARQAKRERVKGGMQEEETVTKQAVVVDDEDYSQWHMDENMERAKSEKALFEEMTAVMTANYSKETPDTPVALLKFILGRKYKGQAKLVDVISEFQRIEKAHKLDQQEQKLAKILVDAIFDFSSVQSIKDSIVKNRDLLGWYSSCKGERDFILMSYLEDAIVTHQYESGTCDILESPYDNAVFDEAFFAEWFIRPPENSYVVTDAEDITALKNSSKPFINWIQGVYDQLKPEEGVNINDEDE